MALIRQYKDPAGGIHPALPRIWNNITPFTEKIALRHGWTAETAEIEDQPVRRRYSKLKLVMALKKLGIWTDVKQSITDAGHEDEFIAANNLEEGNELFDALAVSLQAHFPDVKLNEVLDGCDYEE